MKEDQSAEEIIPRWVRVLMSLASVAFLAATFWLAVNDKSAAATVTGLCALGLIAFAFLPSIDSIEAFGLKAKLRSRIDEADRLVEALKSASLLATKLLYQQIAWSGRMGSADWDTKRKWAAELDDSVRALEVDPRDVEEAKTQFLAFAAFDLYQIFEHMVGERLRLSANAVTKKMGEVPQPMDGQGQALHDSLIAERQRVQSFLPGPANLHIGGALKRMASVVEERLRHLPVPEDDRTKLAEVGERYAAKAHEMFTKGLITDEVEELLRRQAKDHKWWMKEYQQIFGVEPG